jgi:hypothetical protein
MLLGLVLVGCGGGPRQDADEPSGTFKVEVVRASFPRVQHIAERVQLRVRVHNADRRELRNVAVTVETKPKGSDAAVAFGQQERGQELSSAARPVWLLDSGPKGGSTAYVNTWLAGSLRAGETRELTWDVTPAKAGTYTIGYRVSPGLDGKARAARGRTSGSFNVIIIDRPVPARVGDDGKVERGVAAGS